VRRHRHRRQPLGACTCPASRACPAGPAAGHALLVSCFGRSIAVQWTRRDVRPFTRAPPPVPSRGVPRVRFPLSAVFRTGAPGRFHTAPALAVLYPVYRPDITRSPLLPAVFRVQFLLSPVSFLACCCCSLFHPPRSCGRLLLPCHVPYFVFHSSLSSAPTPVPPCPMTSQDLLGSAPGDLCLSS